MTYFHTDSPRDVQWLAHVLEHAAGAHRSVRLDVADDGSLKVKVGEGVWTAPIAGTLDVYRDHCGHDQCDKNKTCTYIV